MAKKKRLRKKSASAPAAGPVVVVAEIPQSFTSDEGVSFHWIAVGEELVNDSPSDRRFALRVGGAVYNHVADAANGAWIYRKDQ